jgi:membrane fusion protein (multidrug efflux system)
VFGLELVAFATLLQASVAVRAVKPTVHADAAALSVPSNLMVDREVSVATRITGVIDNIHVDRGSVVKKGQPLATLDQSEFQLELEAAEENFRLRKAEYDRYRGLFDQKLTSTADLDERKARFEVARVELEKARLVMYRSVIRAPFDGIVVDRFARIGQKVLVDEDDALFKVSALEPMLARAYLPEQSLGRIRLGEPVAVAASEFPDVHAQGRVTFLSPVVEAGSGSFQVIVTVDRDVARVLRPGMAVQLTFNGNGKMILPASCLVPPGKGSGQGRVFEVAQQHLRLRTIEFGPAGNRSIEVRSGISPSALIVDNPAAGLREGQRVDVLEVLK